MQHNFLEVLHNQVLITALIACLLAQFLKLLFEGIRYQKLNFHVLVETGGMPSSHSSLVAALATGVGQTIGWNTTEFAVATVFAIIVMYDASGVRWAAGQQARVLNQMLEQVQPKSLAAQPVVPIDAVKEDGDSLIAAAQKCQESQKPVLKETLGHTPIEVLVGSIVGVTVTLVASITPWASL